MKIIITPTGQEEIRLLRINNTNNIKPKLRQSLSQTTLAKHNTLSPQKSTQSIRNVGGIKKPVHIGIGIDDDKTKKDKLNKIKKITLSKPKVSLTRSMHLKYGSQYEISQNDEMILNPFSAVSTPRNMTKEHKDNIKLRNIFSPKAIKNLKREFIEKEKLSEDLKRQTHKSFRSIFQPKTSEIQVLNNMLLKEINPDTSDLIQYFNKKEYVSPLLIKTISAYDSEKIAKMNKICQILFKNEFERRKYSQNISYRLNQRERSMNHVFTKSMTTLSKEMKETKGILGKYHKKANHRAILQELVSDIKTNYWEKFNVDNLMKLNSKNKRISVNNDDLMLLKKDLMDDNNEADNGDYDEDE